MNPSRRRRALFGLVAFALVGGLTAIIAEVALRVADYPPSNFSPWIRDHDLGFRLAPGIRTRMRGPEYDVEVATNSLGMRDDEAGGATARRILLLGDSFAMGYGVERPKIFADLLEKDLSTEVVNAGTGGYELIQQPRVLAKLGEQFEPDLVVYALYLGNDLAQNDEWEVRSDGSLHNRVRKYPVRQRREIKLLRLARNVVYGVRKGRSEKEGEWLPAEGYIDLCERKLSGAARQDYVASEALLVELAEVSRGLDVPLIVLMIPYRSMVEPGALASLKTRVPDLAENYDLTRPAREIGRILTAQGIPSVDATPVLVEEHRRSGEPLFFPIDGHLNEAGHAAVARLLAASVRRVLGPGGPDL